MWLRFLLFESFVCFLASLPCFASRACPVKAIGLPFHLRDGDDGIRTHDPLLAGQVLSQLSYTPIGVTLVSRVVQFLSKTILFDSP